MHKKRTEDDPMSPLRYSMDLTKLTDEELALFELATQSRNTSSMA